MSNNIQATNKRSVDQTWSCVSRDRALELCTPTRALPGWPFDGRAWTKGTRETLGHHRGETGPEHPGPSALIPEAYRHDQTQATGLPILSSCWIVGGLNMIYVKGRVIYLTHIPVKGRIINMTQLFAEGKVIYLTLLFMMRVVCIKGILLPMIFTSVNFATWRTSLIEKKDKVPLTTSRRMVARKGDGLHTWARFFFPL